MTRVSVEMATLTGFSAIIAAVGLLIFVNPGVSLGVKTDDQTEGWGEPPVFTVVEERQLTSSGYNGVPAWSPDGSHIAYVQGAQVISLIGTGGNIWVMNGDGTGKHALTTDGLDNRYPSWSPDGHSLVFASYRSGNYEIWGMERDGSHLVQLTSHKKSSLQPVWSPDGKKIAFASSRSGGTAIWVMNPDGTGLKQLTPEGTGGYQASWNPRSTQVVFSSAGLTPLTPWQRFWSRWSAGDPLLYCFQDPKVEIPKHLWLLDLQSQEIRQLTQGDSINATPAWSPDGRFLVFARRANEGRSKAVVEPRNLWVFHLASGTMQRLTTDPFDQVYPSWSPDGRQIAFISSKPSQSAIQDTANIWVITLQREEPLQSERAQRLAQ